MNCLPSHKLPLFYKRKGAILVFTLIHDKFNVHNAMSAMKKEIFMTKEHSTRLCRVSRPGKIFCSRVHNGET